MRAIVDHDKCEGHGKCELAAPEVFELRSDELSYVKLQPVPEAQRAAVERAVRLCPRQAISIEQ